MFVWSGLVAQTATYRQTVNKVLVTKVYINIDHIFSLSLYVVRRTSSSTSSHEDCLSQQKGFVLAYTRQFKDPCIIQQFVLLYSSKYGRTTADICREFITIHRMLLAGGSCQSDSES